MQLRTSKLLAGTKASLKAFGWQLIPLTVLGWQKSLPHIFWLALNPHSAIGWHQSFTHSYWLAPELSPDWNFSRMWAFLELFFGCFQSCHQSIVQFSKKKSGLFWTFFLDKNYVLFEELLGPFGRMRKLLWVFWTILRISQNFLCCFLCYFLKSPDLGDCSGWQQSLTHSHS